MKNFYLLFFILLFSSQLYCMRINGSLESFFYDGIKKDKAETVVRAHRNEINSLVAAYTLASCDRFLQELFTKADKEWALKKVFSTVIKKIVSNRSMRSAVLLRHIFQQYNFSVNYLDTFAGDLIQQSPLHYAAENLCANLTRFLIDDCHASTFLRDSSGKSAFQAICEVQRNPMRDPQEFRKLKHQIAGLVLYNIPQCVQWFVDDEKEDINNAIQELFLRYGKQEALQRLSIAALQGTEIAAQNHQCADFLDFLIRQHNLDINFTSDYFYRAGSGTSVRRSPLHLATAAESPGLVVFLLSCGARRDIVDGNGLTPFMQLISCTSAEGRSADPINKGDFQSFSDVHTVLKKLLQYD